MALGQFCDCLKNCADKLEEEIRTNINEFHNMVTEGAVDEVKLALDKAKDYHYKEIIRFIEDIVNDVRKIILHEQEIQRLHRQERMTDDERNRHSYVRRQIHAFNGNAKITKTKREIRRAASELSFNSLEAWENYLDKKDENGLSTSLPELAFAVQKRQTGKSRRNQKNRSSTFNNILDSGSVVSQNLGNISEEDKVEDQVDDSSTAEYSDSVSGSRMKLDSECSSREENGHHSEYFCLSTSRQSDNFDTEIFEKDIGCTVDEDRYRCQSEQSTSQTDGCETKRQMRLLNNNNNNYKTDFGEPSEEHCWSDSECDNESNSPCETDTEDFPVIQLIKSLSEVVESGDTRPKIIDVVYKQHPSSSKDPDGTG